MKTGPYRKFAKAVCRGLEASGKHLSARDFGECAFPACRMTDFRTRKAERDTSRLVAAQKRTPLSRTCGAADMRRRRASKRWRKLSRHRAFVQAGADLGMPERKAAEACFEAEAGKKEKAKHGIRA